MMQPLIDRLQRVDDWLATLRWDFYRSPHYLARLQLYSFQRVRAPFPSHDMGGLLKEPIVRQWQCGPLVIYWWSKPIDWERVNG